MGLVRVNGVLLVHRLRAPDRPLAATNAEEDATIKGKIRVAQVMTVISWCTYPVVYLFPMLGINAASSVVSIQLGYCVSDIISKCGVGIVIYQISNAKSAK